MPPVRAPRPPRSTLRTGAEPGLEGLVEALALAGYERVDRVEERGQFAVRGGHRRRLPLDRPRAAARRALRRRDRAGARLLAVHAARAAHGRRRDRLPGRRAPRSTRSRSSCPDDDRHPTVPTRPRRPLRPARPTSSGSRTRCGAVRLELGLPTSASRASPSSIRSRRARRSRSRRCGPPITARGLERGRERARRASSATAIASSSRSRHRGEALRQQAPAAEGRRRAARAGRARSPTRRRVSFAVADVRRGFVSRDLGVVLLPDGQVFRKKPPRADARLGRALATFADLRVGDYVVHEDHGVGKLLGFETKTVAGVTRDYLFLAFRGEDRLYVPHEQLGKLSKYIGADAKAPTLSKLGGKAWQNLKARARESVRELAGDLLQLYAQRQRAEGVEFDLAQRVARAARGVVPVPRDRRPAARDRGGQGGSRVGAPDGSARLRRRRLRQDRGRGARRVRGRGQRHARCSSSARPRSSPSSTGTRSASGSATSRSGSRWSRASARPAETKQVLADFAEGKVDVLVGTHRVLSRDVIPKDLGLVILDEEQRFGVAQKELVRALRLEVDVLALSATPIPRTLHMSLSGLRDISIIETPPEGRRADPHDRRRVRRGASIRTALEREHAREGQSFYLHNRVETIDERGREAPPAVPRPALHRRPRPDGRARARGEDAHVPRRRRRRPRLDDDHRVGHRHPAGEHARRRARRHARPRRSSTRSAAASAARTSTAHAYLLYPDAMELTPEARARLSTLADHTELGAGFQIAMRDLEIRGAGDLLGAEQSGPRRGARLRALRRDAERGGRGALGAGPRGRAARCASTRGSTPTSPPRTSPSEALKIDLHRRIALVEEEDELRELRAATEDRYGPLPEPVENLFLIQEAKLRARRGRRRLPRAPRGARDDRAGAARLGRAAGAARRARHRRLHRRQEGSLAPRGTISSRAIAPGRCYRSRLVRPPDRAAASRPGRTLSRTSRNVV